MFAREENTVKTHLVAYNAWERWAMKFKLKVLPAESTSLALCILNQIQLGKSFASIRSFYYGIKYVHVSQGYNDPTEHHIVKNMLEAAHRLCKTVIRRKEPLTIEHIQSLNAALLVHPISLMNYRIAIIIILGFFGFLRYSEIANIRRCDIVFSATFFKIFIQHSKCDVYRDGKWVYISASDDSFCCPLQHLLSYLQLAGLTDPNSDEYIIRAISPFKKTGTEKLRACNKPLSYSTAREQFLNALKMIGVKSDIFGLHSLRSGGATAAANMGVPDRLFKKHGRWKSEQVKDGYIKDDVHSLLLVSKCLGVLAET